MKQGQNLYFSQQKHLGNRRGQAVIEYILLCVVIVGMLLAAKQIFSSVNKTINAYIGEYLTCLMEYGELPSLGVARAELKKHESQGKTCEAKFEPFTFVAGRPASGGGSGSGSGPGSGDGSGSGQGSNSGDRNSNSASNNSGGSSGSSGDSDSSLSRGGRSGRGSGAARRGVGRNELAGSSNPNGYTDGELGNSSKKRVLDGDDLDSDESGSRRRGRRRFYSRTDVIEYKAVTGGLAKQIQKQEEKRKMSRKPTTVTKSIVTDEGSLNFRSSRRVFTPPEKAKINDEDQSSQKMTFGWFIRVLMIAAMILAIIVFFGGQVLNYTKSKE